MAIKLFLHLPLVIELSQRGFRCSISTAIYSSHFQTRNARARPGHKQKQPLTDYVPTLKDYYYTWSSLREKEISTRNHCIVRRLPLQGHFDLNYNRMSV